MDNAQPKTEPVITLETLADDLLRLKQEADNATMALDMAKLQARELANVGPNGKQVEVLTAETWLTVRKSGRYSAPTEDELAAIGADLTARLFRKTAKIKPNSRANWKAFLKRLDSAGIDYDGYFEAVETVAAVKDFGEAVDYELAELDGDEAQALTAVVERITQPATVTIRPADMHKDNK